MTRPLQVLLLESHPSAGEAAADALVAAGHEVVRCHGPGSPGFPCAGLLDRDACPLRRGVDVAIDVRRADVGHEPTSLEDGVGCALRAGIPVVELSDPGHESSMRPWTIAASAAGVVPSVEEASAGAFGQLRAEILAKLDPLFVANGVAAGTIDCELERVGDGLVVHLIGPPVSPGLRQAASVRAYDVVRAGLRAFEEVRLGDRTVVAA
jgi:hypothetical protein